MSRIVLCVLMMGCLSGPQLPADDWNQWMGPNRDGTWNATGTTTDFPEGGPKLVWRAPVASGYSGPSVANGKVFISDFVRSEGDATPNPGRRNELLGKERLHCLDAATGQSIWNHEYDCTYRISYPNGPRATPTVDGDRVYFLGAEGTLTCLNTESGDVVWTLDLKQKYQMDEAPFWGFAAHPLVDEKKIYIIAGGNGSIAVALDKLTGDEIWKSLRSRSSGYCPPTMIESGGVRQLLIFHPQSLNSLNPENGEVYWSFQMEPAYDMSIIAPIRYENFLYTTALQGTSLLLKLDPDRPAATEVWRGNGVFPDHNPPLIVDGHIYGVDVKGHLRCIELESGQRLWESLATAPNGRPASSTTGFIVKNNDHYYLMTEQGELIIAKLSPAGYEELDRAKILQPTAQTGNRDVVWSHPAFADRCVFARNDKEIVCYSLAK